MASLDPLDRELFRGLLTLCVLYSKRMSLTAMKSLKPHCVANYSLSLCLTE